MRQDVTVPAASTRHYGGLLDDERGDISLRLAAAIRTIDLENRRMRAEMARIIGLSDNEFGALGYISEVQQPTPKSLVAELNLTTGAVTAMIDRLETAGLVERRAHPTDRRSTVLALTANGDAVKEWIYGTYRSAIAEATAVCGPECSNSAVRVLLKASTFISASTEALDPVIPGFTTAD